MKTRNIVSAATLGLAFTTMPALSETWNMQSTYPGSLTQLGTIGVRIAEQITKVTGGEITVQFQEPGAIVPALETFDAVSTGAVEAGWSTPGYWSGKVPALPLFAAVPFGPQAGEYMAWMKFGGGYEMMDEIYQENNIKSLLCAVIAPRPRAGSAKRSTASMT